MIFYLNFVVTILVKIKFDKSNKFMCFVHQCIFTRSNNTSQQKFVEWIHEWTQAFFMVYLYSLSHYFREAKMSYKKALI